MVREYSMGGGWGLWPGVEGGTRVGSVMVVWFGVLPG